MHVYYIPPLAIGVTIALVCTLFYLFLGSRNVIPHDPALPHFFIYFAGFASSLYKDYLYAYKQPIKSYSTYKIVLDIFGAIVFVILIYYIAKRMCKNLKTANKA